MTFLVVIVGIVVGVMVLFGIASAIMADFVGKLFK